MRETAYSKQKLFAALSFLSFGLTFETAQTFVMIIIEIKIITTLLNNNIRVIRFIVIHIKPFYILRNLADVLIL
jgi:hypothetical protein